LEGILTRRFVVESKDLWQAKIIFSEALFKSKILFTDQFIFTIHIIIESNSIIPAFTGKVTNINGQFVTYSYRSFHFLFQPAIK
jgi:hypothetical protein